MDAITDIPLDLPVHDEAPLRLVPSRVVTEWPVGTFVENLAPLDDGSFAISVLSEARLDRVWPDGRHETMLQLAAPPTGLVRVRDNLYICVGVPDQTPSTLWRLDLSTGDAGPLFVAEGAIFMNGMAALSDTVLLAAEAAQGRVLRLDLETESTSTWIQDERLTRWPGASFLPGTNGIKSFGGYVYVTSNARALLCRMEIRSDGSSGPLELCAERMRGDDLAFDVDGNLYVATHMGHTLDRIAPGGERVTLAGPDQGLAGSTACAFGIAGPDCDALYVTTTGGIIGPKDGAVQPARLVRLEIGATGAPLVPTSGAQ
ncbi:SMP-30/gluconolactonase/LRE family protein [Mycobacterium sp.]|uniref:SMP-30/gluconolactonase/LRE family protein n=1 Tax=Mycobacterium sp. TaxID=1785 RepID=UPI003D0CCF8F